MSTPLISDIYGYLNKTPSQTDTAGERLATDSPKTPNNIYINLITELTLHRKEELPLTVLINLALQRISLSKSISK